MAQREASSLAEVLTEKKDVLIAKWFQHLLRAYPESSEPFLSEQRDPFRNPVGHTLKEGLSIVFDRLVQAADGSATERALDPILRIRAVQDISASQAVAFIFFLKRIVRAEFSATPPRFAEELLAFEARIDEMALLAFDLFMKCRERIFEIKANESRRMNFLNERPRVRETADAVDRPASHT